MLERVQISYKSRVKYLPPMGRGLGSDNENISTREIKVVARLCLVLKESSGDLWLEWRALFFYENNEVREKGEREVRKSKRDLEARLSRF